MKISQYISKIIDQHPKRTNDEYIELFKNKDYQEMVLSISCLIISMLDNGSNIMDAYYDDYISNAWSELLKEAPYWNYKLAGWSTYAYIIIRRANRDYIINTGALNQGIVRFKKMKYCLPLDYNNEIYMEKCKVMPYNDLLNNYSLDSLLCGFDDNFKELVGLVYSVHTPRFLNSKQKDRIFKLVKEFKLRKSNNYKIFTSTSFWAALRQGIQKIIIRKMKVRGVDLKELKNNLI